MTSTTTRATTGTVAAAACAALVLLMSSGAASAAEPRLNGRGVIHYQPQGLLKDAKRYLKRGRKTSTGACVFTFSGTIGPRKIVDVVDRELAFRRRGCLALRERGTPVGPEPDRYKGRMPKVRSDRSRGDGKRSRRMRGDSKRARASVYYGRWKAGLKGYYEEPAQLNVSELNNWIYWSPNGNCADPEFNATYHYRPYWTNETGWYKIWDDWAAGSDCNRVFSESYGEFGNDLFCDLLSLGPWPAPETLTHHELNRVVGYPDSSMDWFLTLTKEGGCSFLLHQEHRLTHEPA